MFGPDRNDAADVDVTAVSNSSAAAAAAAAAGVFTSTTLLQSSSGCGRPDRSATISSRRMLMMMMMVMMMIKTKIMMTVYMVEMDANSILIINDRQPLPFWTNKIYSSVTDR